MPDPALRYQRIASLVLVGVTLLRLLWLVGDRLDLYPDEAQYWLWSKDLAFGYFSKPPMIAWLIALTSAVFGEDEFGVRLAAPLLHLATGFIIFAIGKRLYDARTGCWSAVIYITLPAVSLSASIISTDVPLLFCWALALYAFIRAREGGRVWWIVVGLAAGLGLLAKYAMAYWLLSAFIFTLAFPEERRHLRFLLGAAGLALLVYAPNFAWNAANGFVSYRHTRDNANLAGSLIHPQAFLEFAGSQFGVFGPILFGALLLLATVYARDLRDPRARLLGIFALPTLAMMLIVSFLSRAHPNWAAPTYIAATPLVVAWLLSRGRRGLLMVSLGLHVFIALFLVEGRQAAAALGYDLPAKIDLAHRLRGWRLLGRTVGEQIAQHPGAVLLSDSRENLASLIYYVQPHPFDAVIWNPGGTVNNHFEMTTDMTRMTGADFIFVSPTRIAPDMADRFTTVEVPVHVTIPLGGGLTREYFIYTLRGFKGYR